jgi:hypothetical protein
MQDWKMAGKREESLKLVTESSFMVIRMTIPATFDHNIGVRRSSTVLRTCMHNIVAVFRVIHKIRPGVLAQWLARCFPVAKAPGSSPGYIEHIYFFLFVVEYRFNSLYST